MTIVEFLRDRLDDDEQVAQGVSPGGPSPLWHLNDDHGYDALVIDSARVLSEVTAKRHQIDMTFRYEATIDGEWGCCHEAESIARGECSAIPVDGIRMLRLLALPYAEHPGYRSEWSPDE